jgi:hypothetical protein
MPVDETEAIRRQMQTEINSDQRAKEELEKEYGKAWTTDELREEFEIIGFLAPLVAVRRLADGKKGSLKQSGHSL